MKCLDTGVDKVFLGFFALAVCSYILDLYGLPVSPIYCLLHLVHCMRYTMLYIYIYYIYYVIYLTSQSVFLVCVGACKCGYFM